MNFTAPSYFLFLPLTVLLHWLLPHKARWILLLLASWLFYFLWDPAAGGLLVLTTLVTWGAGLGTAASENDAAKRLWTFLGVFFPLAALGVFKYAGFFASAAGMTLPMKILLPVGISFYTFQGLSYVLDVYRGRIRAEKHFGHYALFVAFFPQVVAGPIERASGLLPQLRQERVFRKELLSEGAWLLLCGYFKKLVIADLLAPFSDPVFADPAGAAGPSVLLAAVTFGIRILCDFSGYTDIARGSALLLGIRLSENFDRPYAAASIRDFWRRWHKTLTSWFTDYVYIPLGGNRKGVTRRILNVLAVFLLSGLWHGAAWHFVLWGAVHGILFSLEILFRKEERGGGRASRVLTFLAVSLSWILFRAETVRDAFRLYSGLFTGWNTLPVRGSGALLLLFLTAAFVFLERVPPYREIRDRKMIPPAVFFLLLAAVLAVLVLSGSGTENAFIYFRF
ncbi:MAG: MBOAT family protein [Lachnospiraceae bacterium]|nr:MBOAT family protein [Lachnospiraceae bacterium]